MMKKYFALICAVMFLSACGSSTNDVDGYGTMKRTNGREVIDQQHGKETTMLYGAMQGVAPVNANGVAFLSTFADGVSRLRLSLNIELAPKGVEYTVSIANPTTKESMELGSLTSLVGDVRHGLSVEKKSLLDGFTTVRVTKKGVLVAEGILKKTK